jgi:type IV pilus assembly protein PilX
MKPLMKRPCRGVRRQRGMALVCALFLMLGTAMFAMSVARMALASLASAERERDRAVARAAAEAALRDGERDVNGAATHDACDDGAPRHGTCGGADPPEPDPPDWQTTDLAAPDAAGVVPYGAVTGARMAVGGALLPARLPAYLVERLASTGQGAVFRITAIGFGTRAATRTVLQSLYRVPAGAAGKDGAPASRIGWREIANWPELHARATR